MIFSKYCKTKKFASKGAISVLVVFAVMGTITIIALSTAKIASRELGFSSNVSDSINAFYAAESGTEQALYYIVRNGADPTASEVKRCTLAFDDWDVSLGNAKYCVIITGSLAVPPLIAIKGIGEYKTTRRSVEISF